MKSFLQFFDFLTEKQLQYGGNANYGQIVFFAGGSASGKGVAISNYIDNSKFKVRDVDDLKLKLQRMPTIRAKYPEIDIISSNLKDPENVRRLHEIAILEKLPEKQFSSWVKGMTDPLTLPNLLFDMTFKKLTDAEEYVPKLLSVGYKPENIHITWVLANYDVAVQRNKFRERVVPEDILLATHTGAALTMAGILGGNLPRGFNGSFTIILNNPDQVSYYPDKIQYDQKTSKPIVVRVVKDFTYIKVKDAGKPMVSLDEMENAVKTKIIDWVLENAPSSKEIESAFTSRAARG
jgi:hypothetical protein